MYEMNKLLHGQGACTGFSHSFFLYQKSSERAQLARSISPTLAKIPYARPAHEASNLYVYRPWRKQNGKSNLSIRQ